jgi:hypothetical protein
MDKELVRVRLLRLSTPYLLALWMGMMGWIVVTINMDLRINTVMALESMPNLELRWVGGGTNRGFWVLTKVSEFDHLDYIGRVRNTSFQGNFGFNFYTKKILQLMRKSKTRNLMYASKKVIPLQIKVRSCLNINCGIMDYLHKSEIWYFHISRFGI